MNEVPARALRVLIVDDEESICRMLVRDLKNAGMAPRAAPGGAAAIRELESDEFDVVVSDMLMPEVDGLDVLRHARSLTPAVPVIMITGYGNIEQAVKAMKAGASDFIPKPLDRAALIAAIRVAHRPKESGRAGTKASHLVGSPGWLEPFSKVLVKIADSNKVVLLLGETGTGKSAVAKEIARLSSRTGRFVELNCASIPETLLEPRLFGTVEGAFTDAKNAPGVLEVAEGGTVFLDEIGELKPDLQAALLHVLQEKRYTRVGGTTELTANVRFIAATNKNLAEEVEKGSFRRDLFHRLDQLVVTIPPLRERANDIPILLEHFRRECEDEVPPFAPEAVQTLMRYEWPGNIRELKNLVDRFGVFAEPDRPIAVADVEPHVGQHVRDLVPPSAAPTVTTDLVMLEEREADPDGGFSIELEGQGLEDAINGYMRAIIVEALKRNGGNKSRTARELKVKRTTLIERCRKLGITDEED